MYLTPYPWYPAVFLYLAILQQIHCIPLYPTVVSSCMLYSYVSSCIQLYLLYLAVSRCIYSPYPTA